MHHRNRSMEAVLGGFGETSSREGAAVDPILRAKYLDYCSARVAEALLRLTADDMYVLGQEVAGGSGEGEADVLSFSTIVRLATERLTEGLSLPDFPEWVREYDRNPEKFEQEMIGLWEADATTPDRAAT